MVNAKANSLGSWVLVKNISKSYVMGQFVHQNNMHDKIWQLDNIVLRFD